jgi:hypothetical protein
LGRFSTLEKIYKNPDNDRTPEIDWEVGRTMKHLRRYIREVLENHGSFDEIISAIHEYTGLSQDTGTLRGLLGTPELKSFMLEIQNQIPAGNIWASRKLNFRDQYIADKWYVEEGKGEKIELKGPISFYYGGTPPTEFAENRYTLRLKIPREKIIFHSQYNDFGWKSEREILTESMTIVVTSVHMEDDWEGNIIGAQVSAKVVG